MPMLLGAVMVGEAAWKIGSGLVKAGKAKKEAAHLDQTRPKASISGEIKDDLSLAESDLSNGISSKALQAYTEQQDKGMSTGVSTIQRMGGSANNIGDLFGKSQEGAGSLAMLQEQSRQQKVANLIRSRQAYANEEQKVFEFNEWKPWADKAQANSQAKQAASNEINSGIDTAFSAATGFAGNKISSAATDKANSQELKKMQMYFDSGGGSRNQTPQNVDTQGSSFNKGTGYNFNSYLLSN